MLRKGLSSFGFFSPMSKLMIHSKNHLATCLACTCIWLDIVGMIKTIAIVYIIEFADAIFGLETTLLATISFDCFFTFSSSFLLEILLLPFHGSN